MQWAMTGPIRKDQWAAGIGMDDTFVLLAAWRRTDDRLSVPERLAHTYADAGVSITITSLTNFISFWIGVITPFPCVRIFCIYTAMSVLFTYIYHVTFFGGCMALSGYAEQRNLHSFICVPTMPKSLAQDRGRCFMLFCTGGRNPLDPDNPIDNQENMMMKFFRDKLGVFLSKKPVKFVIIVSFLVYLSIGLWGCTKVKEGLERFKMARYDSYSLDYYDLEDKYFRKYPYRIQVVINQTLDYSDPKVQDEIEDLLHRLESNHLMAGPRFTESWLRIYHRFLKDSRTQVFLQGYNMSKKEDFYKGIHQVFFRLSQNYFQQDIKFNEDFTEITAARFVLQTENIMNANDEKNMLLELRAIAANSTLPVVVFNQLFVLFDQFLLIKETSIQAVGVATAVMMLISFIFIPIPSCALWVAFSIFSIEIGVVGYMSWWNVNLDAISMINLILCIGFSVDYSAHITYAYISSEQKDPDIRMKNALHSLGLPIAQGSVSTLLGIVILNAAPSYIFTVFFKTVFLVILFAAVHGLLLLPVLLSMTDGWCSGAKKGGDAVTEKEGSPPFYITSQHDDILTNKDGKISVPTYKTLADPHFPAIMEEPKYKTAATWTDNADLDQGIGTSGESSDGSWRGGNDEIIDHANQLHGSSSQLTSVGQPHESPRSREREDHVNPGFVDDDGIRASDRSRMKAYHQSNLDGKLNYTERWDDLHSQQGPPTKNHTGGKDLQNRRNSEPDSPLSRYMARLNSGYVREFQMPL
ncbi:UNVERIFIED_CONTAM: Ptchd3 [Trichonephila clavipes]